ncbi:hypothetical protein V2J09_005537 [Rumex salicifolius]
MQSSSLLHLSPTTYLKPKLASHSPEASYPCRHVLPLRLSLDSASSPSSMTHFLSSYQLNVHSRNAIFVPKATSSIPDGGSVDMNGLFQTLRLGAMFAFWYLLNIYFNILNKQVLQIYPFPATVSAFQFGCGTVFSLLMWALNLHIKPNITYSQLLAIVPLAIAHATGNLLTNISLGKVAVSFTHTIKAMEPLFTVSPSLWVVSSLVPIVGGVALASLTEVSFNWTGFYSVMVSNLVNQSRNVFSKKLMTKKEETLDDVNLFSIMTIMSFILLMPAAFLIDGVRFTPSYLQYAMDSQGLTVKMLATKLVLSAMCLHYYQQISYVILLMVSPVTHSVGNCLKRVVVIVSSVIFFRTPVSPANLLGTTLALIGVFLYTKARKIKPKLKAT